ncbi:hypothetical protein KAI65_02175 [Candidatus Parcubacteria bacterium]|nr:hypothetical protein [Candidatus Parcubacteria bacterium]
MGKQEETKEDFFELEGLSEYTIIKKGQPCSSHVSVKISVNDETEIQAADGIGPVYVIDSALRKALEKFYVTDLDSMFLVDFNVHIFDGHKSAASKVRVTIEFQDESEHWTKIGISENLIKASWLALADGFRYKLAKNGKK